MNTDPNVLLVVLDCVRARNTDLVGRRVGTTPRMRALADGAFTNHTSARIAAPWSLPSHVSMFTSTSPIVHQVTTQRSRLRHETTVFSRLSNRGYETGVFTENPYLCTQEFGVEGEFDYVDPFLNTLFPEGLSPQEYALEGARAFLTDAVDSGRPLRSLANGAYAFFMQTRVGSVLDARRDEGRVHAENFLEWSASKDTWAACLNFVDAHAPYVPTDAHNLFAKSKYRRSPEHAHPDSESPGDVLNNAERLYDGCIHQTDAVVGHIVDKLRERGEFDETLIVVTADHGEAFGEPHEVTGQPLVGHKGGFNEVQAHVPLLVKQPGQRSGDEIDELATPVMFANSVMDTLEGNNSSFTVDSLVGEYQYESNNLSARVDPSYSFPDEYITVGYEQCDGHIRKYVRDRGTEKTFRVTSEGAFATEDPNRIDELLEGVEGKSLRSDREVSLSGETQSRLKELGYIED